MLSAGPCGKARSEWICVMDADLQRVSPSFSSTEEAARSKADVVVASRYCATGDWACLGHPESAIAWLRPACAGSCPPRRLGVSDPMSGSSSSDGTGPFSAWVKDDPRDPPLRPTLDHQRGGVLLESAMLEQRATLRAPAMSGG